MSLLLLNRLFPVWAVLVTALAMLFPSAFVSAKVAIIPLLSMVMFFMGLTLSVEDFRRVLLMPRAIAIGVVAQFLIMPLLAYSLARLLQLPPELATGLIVVGCCAGGTASNVICYLAKGDVALSITMTAVSTLLAVVLTPLLCRVYINTSIAVDQLAMLISLVKMVLLPVILGLLLQHYFKSVVARLETFLPSCSIVIILLLIAIIVALNQDQLTSVGPLLLLAVVLHNGMGMALAYVAARGLRLSVVHSRTVAIEVGMQNSGLGVALAIKYFTPLAALPGAVFSVWHNIAGSLVASYWSRNQSLENSLVSAADKQHASRQREN